MGNATTGYKPNVISTVVDSDVTAKRSKGYKPNVISTVVDGLIGSILTGEGYKPNVISTVVDYGINIIIIKGL